MYLVASVRPSVQQRAKRSHYQFEVFVCVWNKRADAVDRLLIRFAKKGLIISEVISKVMSEVISNIAPPSFRRLG